MKSPDMPTATDPFETRRKQLLYRATHRGFKEADLVIGGFARARIASMSADDLAAFAELIEAPDHDLYAWVVQGAPAPERFCASLIAEMAAFDASAPFRRI